MGDEIPLDEWKKCLLIMQDDQKTGECVVSLQKGNKITGTIKVDKLVFLAHADYYIKKLADEYNLHKGGEDE